MRVYMGLLMSVLCVLFLASVLAAKSPQETPKLLPFPGDVAKIVTLSRTEMGTIFGYIAKDGTPKIIQYSDYGTYTTEFVGRSTD